MSGAYAGRESHIVHVSGAYWVVRCIIRNNGHVQGSLWRAELLHQASMSDAHLWSARSSTERSRSLCNACAYVPFCVGRSTEGIGN